MPSNHVWITKQEITNKVTETIAESKETNEDIVKNIVQEELNKKPTPLNAEEIKEIIQKEIKSATDEGKTHPSHLLEQQTTPKH